MPEEAQLSIKELSDIIKLCRKNGVLSLKFHGIELNLEKDFKDALKAQKPNKRLVALDATEELDANREIFDEYEADHLMVNDPEAYEQIIRDDINNGRKA